MENQLIGLIGAVMVAFALILIFAVGLVTIVKKVREYNQHRTGDYITRDQAKKFIEENASIKASLKNLQKKSMA